MAGGATAPVDTNVLIGKGKLYFDRGNTGSFIFMGNCPLLEISTEDETRKLYSSAEASAPLLKQALIRRSPKINFTLNEFTPANLALSFMGVEATVATQAATPVTGEVLAAQGMAGHHYQTLKRGPITAVTLDAGATPLVAVTDYEVVNSAAGIIYIKQDSPNIDTTPGALSIDYTPGVVAADAMASVLGGVSPVIEGGVLFIPDPSTGPKWEIRIWKASLTPDGGFNLIGDDFAEFKMVGEMLSDSVNHPTEPFYRAVLIP